MTTLLLAMVPDDSDRDLGERSDRRSGPRGSGGPTSDRGTSSRSESVLPVVRLIVASILIGITCIIFLVGLYNPRLQVPPGLVALATIAATWLFGSSILRTGKDHRSASEGNDG